MGNNNKDIPWFEREFLNWTAWIKFAENPGDAHKNDNNICVNEDKFSHTGKNDQWNDLIR